MAKMASGTSLYLFLAEEGLRGTLAPARRACDSPIAIACFRLFTFLPDLPLSSVPAFRSCIAFSTFSEAFLPYLAMAAPLEGGGLLPSRGGWNLGPGRFRDAATKMAAKARLCV
jgi:hypothetical protein